MNLLRPDLTIDQALLYSSDISIPTKMALYTYVVDTRKRLQVIARSENTRFSEQENRVESSGGITEINLGWGTEISKKFMAGLSLGINIVKQEQRTYFHESDATEDTNNDFNFLAYDETLTLKGYGMNLRGGLIYRPKDYIRLRTCCTHSYLDAFKRNNKFRFCCRS